MSTPVSKAMRDVFVPEVPQALAEAAAGLRITAASPALQGFRAEAWAAFEKLGIPGTKHEDFSYVSSADLKAALTRVPAPSAKAEVEGDVGGETASFSFVNGNLASFSIPENLGLHALAEGDLPEDLLNAWTIIVAAEESDAPAALAWSLARQPLALDVSKGSKVAIRLNFSGTAARADHALFIRVGENAEATVSIESDFGAEAFANTAIAFSLAPGARLRAIQADAPEGFQLLKLRFDLAKDARVEFLSASTGSRLARLALEAVLSGPGAEADLRGATAVAGTNRAHRHLRIRHAAPDCRSNQIFKAVVPGAGLSSVDGTVIVDRGAQRTDARQLLQHLLLSPEGRANAKPRLLIHADDVKCSHGATVGKTDPAQRFYLLSRGLSPAEADRVLTQAFLGEALLPFVGDPAAAPVAGWLMEAVTGGRA
ncbi:MAG TPA: SufD family Fe-S cluster assembly protein [Fibrobacteria bacterium]|nr:SufD family Fe-S cluster assembly protein [Fibrobacteria bacterium]